MLQPHNSLTTLAFIKLNMTFDTFEHARGRELSRSYGSPAAVARHAIGYGPWGQAVILPHFVCRSWTCELAATSV